MLPWAHRRAACAGGRERVVADPFWLEPSAPREKVRDGEWQSARPTPRAPGSLSISGRQVCPRPPRRSRSYAPARGRGRSSRQDSLVAPLAPLEAAQRPAMAAYAASFALTRAAVAVRAATPAGVGKPSAVAAKKSPAQEGQHGANSALGRGARKTRWLKPTRPAQHCSAVGPHIRRQRTARAAGGLLALSAATVAVGVALGPLGPAARRRSP